MARGLEGLAELLRNYQVRPTDYQQSVLSGDYLREGNPYQEAMLERMRNEYQDSLGGVTSPFAANGRFGSGAMGAALALANDRYNTGVGALQGQLYEGERDRQQQVAGMLSGENTAARGNLSGFAGILRQVAGAIKQAQIGASASRYATDANRALGFAGLQQNADQQAWQRMLDTYGIANQQNQGNINQRMQPINMLQGFSSTTLPILQNFGTTTQTQTQQGGGPGPVAGGLMGGIGGAATGYGVGQGIPRRGNQQTGGKG